MQFVLINNSDVLVENTLYDYYKQKLPEHNFIPVFDISSPYPTDCLLNITLLDEICFMTKYQALKIGKYINKSKIFVNQGYTKCNICILNDKAIITSDKGIAESAQKNDIRAYLLPNDEIVLKGYKNGFWGGCSGLIDSDKLFFNGDIKKLSCYKELLTVLKKEKIEPIFFQGQNLEDCGSIIPIC